MDVGVEGSLFCGVARHPKVEGGLYDIVLVI